MKDWLYNYNSSCYTDLKHVLTVKLSQYLFNQEWNNLVSSKVLLLGDNLLYCLNKHTRDANCSLFDKMLSTKMFHSFINYSTKTKYSLMISTVDQVFVYAWFVFSVLFSGMGAILSYFHRCFLLLEVLYLLHLKVAFLWMKAIGMTFQIYFTIRLKVIFQSTKRSNLVSMSCHVCGVNANTNLSCRNRNWLTTR